MKFKLLSAIILTALSATAFSATEQTFSDGLKIKLNEKSTGSDLRIYKDKPVLAIANPDKNKISHNYFDEFNVGKEGLYIGNTKKANTIITEVVSNSPSLLKGNINVLINPANVVIANPNGITCDGCSVSNVKNLNLITAAVAVTTDKNQINTVNSKDKKLKITNSHIETPGKLSLISNKISIINSTIGSSEINIDMLTSADKILLKTGEYDKMYYPSEKLKVVRSPAKLYIDNKSTLVGNDINLNLPETEFTNDGHIAVDNVRINSNLSPYHSKADNGKIIHMSNNGKISSDTFNLYSEESTLENHGNITARKNMKLELTGSTFTNNGKIDSMEHYRHESSLDLINSQIINNGEMKVRNLLVNHTAKSAFTNAGDLYFSSYYAKDIGSYHPDDLNEEFYTMKNTGNLYYYAGSGKKFRKTDSL
ncbi:filamentous hemagglutinin N-terminal domain-containing protein [Morganella morganii]|uniref:two-partner secretion domain-containing protein n=1 Tax=Morganella morganii TaxID=582 RepID=UPI000FF803B7|nr:filamentous hemagglutinin N-terminal domain-containing protein [Morganella morganii]ROJ31761.1 hypothetical protein BFD15_06215 [Morganella morganii]